MSTPAVSVPGLPSQDLDITMTDAPTLAPVGPALIDWDHQLLGFDWSSNDWRNEIEVLSIVPCTALQQSTVHKVAVSQAQYDINYRPYDVVLELSPIQVEMFHRIGYTNERIVSLSVVEARSIFNYLISLTGTAETTPHPQVSEQSVPPGQVVQPRKGSNTDSDLGSRLEASFRSDPPKPEARKDLPGSDRRSPKQTATEPSPEPVSGTSPDQSTTQGIAKSDTPGLYTVGFELEVTIAVRPTANAVKGKPHPNETRLVSESSDDALARAYWQQRTVDQVLGAMNSQTDLVFIRKDEDEGKSTYDLRTGHLVRLDQADDRNSLMAHTRGVGDEVEKSARAALDELKRRSYFNADAGRDIRLLTEKDVTDAVDAVLTSGLPQARDRLGDLIRLESFRAKRDPHHVYLHRMKPRYRAFSAYCMDTACLGPVRSEDYADPPHISLGNPKHLYQWENIKVSSPVLRLDEKIQDILASVIQTLRNNFAIHKDMASIPVTTQIVLSHTTGFSLLELKKIITMVAVFEGHIRRLNRKWRAPMRYDRICGPLKEVSKIGSVVYNDPEPKIFDTLNILPQPSDNERGFFRQQLHNHVPLQVINESFSDTVFYTALWHYRSISDLSRGVGTGDQERKPAFVTKCKGGSSTAPFNENAIVPDSQIDFGFNVVDAERGVFEFRHCSASLDPEHIYNWMIVCHRLMDAARTQDDYVFRETILRFCSGRTTFMEAIGVPRDIQAYFVTRMQRCGYFNPDDGPISWNDPFWEAV
ncbi:hypothetical protein GGR54DRAFT_213737 [Hypoxylon sp. NC1633]|nr:hypothetical protein GGR54DRAFT_213737 [Hypoxylon sp. NC1633]